MIMVAALIISFNASSENYSWDFKPYFKVGAGYKFKETQITYNYGNNSIPYSDKDLSARFELGAVTGNWNYGFAHRSQWFQGWPINNKREYSVYEVFVDYTLWL